MDFAANLFIQRIWKQNQHGFINRYLCYHREEKNMLLNWCIHKVLGFESIIETFNVSEQTQIYCQMLSTIK